LEKSQGEGKKEPQPIEDGERKKLEEMSIKRPKKKTDEAEGGQKETRYGKKR